MSISSGLKSARGSLAVRLRPKSCTSTPGCVSERSSNTLGEEMVPILGFWIWIFNETGALLDQPFDFLVFLVVLVFEGAVSLWFCDGFPNQSHHRSVFLETEGGSRPRSVPTWATFCAARCHLWGTRTHPFQMLHLLHASY